MVRTHDFRVDSQAAAVARRRARRALFGDPSDPVRLGRYIVERPVGQGAMGVVFRGLDPSTGRSVAIKRLHRIVSPHRLRAEARALAALDHPAIVPIFDVIESGERSAIVMQFIEGLDLRLWAIQQRPSVEAMVETLRNVAEAVECAHRAGILHRDIKPENILCDAAGRPYLLDFGLAKPIDLPARPMLQRASGTPAYLAPEVIAGGPHSPASDQYALCLVGLHVLEACRSKWPSNVRRRAVAVLQRGTDGDPQRRHPSLDSLAQQLGGLVRGSSKAFRGWAAATVTVTATLMMARSTGKGPCDSWDDPSGEGSMWSEHSRTELAGALQQNIDDPERVRRTLKKIDSYVDSWTRQAELSCQIGTPVQQQCLSNTRQRFHSATRVLSSVGNGSLPSHRSASVLADLPRPSECGQAAPAPRARLPLATRDALHLAWVLGSAQEHVQAKKAATRVLTATENRPSPERAEALLLMGAAHHGLKEYDAAEQRLEEAAWEANLVGAPAVAAEAARRRMVLALWLGELDVGKAWFGFASTAMETYEASPLMVARFAMSHGYFLAKHEQIRPALEVTEQGLELIERELGWEHPLTPTALRNIASYHLQLEEFDRAMVAADIGLDVALRIHGQRHPITLELANDLAISSAVQGETETAVRQWSKIVDAAATMGPVARMQQMNAETNLAVEAAKAGERDAAVAFQTQALASARFLFHQSHPVVRRTGWCLDLLEQGRSCDGPTVEAW